MARWSPWDQLPHSSKLQLHLQISNQGSDWVLLLLPINSDAPSCWRIWRNQYLSETSNPDPLPNPGWRFHFINWRLVQDKP